MERTAQLVPLHVPMAIVHLKIAVANLMVKHAQMQPLGIAEPQALEPRVRGRGMHCVEHQMKDQMYLT